MKSLRLAVIVLILGASWPRSARAGFSCPEIIKRAGLRIVLKERHDPYPGFGSRSIYVQLPKPPPEPEVPMSSSKWKQSWRAVNTWHQKNLKTLGTLATTLRQSTSREATRRDLDVHLVDGPVARATERRYGHQKQLTIPAKLLASIPASIVTSLVLHALFPNTVLDPQVWIQKKEEILQDIGLEFNEADLEYYLRNHPAFADLHKSYLAVLKLDPEQSILPSLKLVLERMAEYSLAQKVLQDAVGDGTPLTPEGYKSLYATLHNPQASEADIKNLPRAQRAALNRMLLAEALVKQAPSEVTAPLRPLQLALFNMYATLASVENGEPLSESMLTSQPGIEAELKDPRQRFVRIDHALINLLNAEVNNYWQLDIHIDPNQIAKYVETEPMYAPAAQKLLTSEREIHARMQSLKNRATHPYYFQSAMSEYAQTSLNLEWMNALGLQPLDPAMRSKESLLQHLEEMLEAKHRLKPPTK